MTLGSPTPILRSFDEAKARAFYIDFLGFAVAFEHRFGPKMPLYLGLVRDGCELHLSEHHGDTTPGTRIRVPVADLDAFAADLASRPDAGIRVGEPEDRPWGERDLTLTDPFGNRLTFYAHDGA